MCLSVTLHFFLGVYGFLRIKAKHECHTVAIRNLPDLPSRSAEQCLALTHPQHLGHSESTLPMLQNSPSFVMWRRAVLCATHHGMAQSKDTGQEFHSLAERWASEDDRSPNTGQHQPTSPSYNREQRLPSSPHPAIATHTPPCAVLLS